MARVLVVDDDPLVCTLIRNVLNRRGHEVSIATNGERGVQFFQKHRPAVTVLDLSMPGMNGLEVLKQIRALDPSAPVIVLTGAGATDLEMEVKALGVKDVLYKGSSLRVLTRTLEEVTRASERDPLDPPD
ncbi:MAG TPA: response regulator [Nitrospiraceae bacterium]|jgi:DNA-binding response OmpR family regulator|nr:response regulator [Nitrospiraceae bacterium]